MHEMTLVRKVVDLVLESCEGEDVARVRSVHLYIGDLHDVVDDFVPGLFQHLARGTIAESARITITHVPATVICNQCGFVFPLDPRDETTWKCPYCAARRDYRLYTGREFFVDSIEVEGLACAADEGHVRAPDETKSRQDAEEAAGQDEVSASAAETETRRVKEAMCA